MAAALVMGFAAAANAQENKLVVKPSGRILMDAAFLNSSNKAVDEQCVDGVNVPDIRIGMKVSYGKWEGKADIGYARGSVSPKDIFIQYNFNKQNLRLRASRSLWRSLRLTLRSVWAVVLSV